MTDSSGMDNNASHCKMERKTSTTSEAQSYYTKGSTELATETALTVKRLEPRRKLTKSLTRTVIAMVGLPARGKSFVSRKMLLYLQWSGVHCKVFNVGKYRREAHAAFLQEHGPISESSSEASGTPSEAQSTRVCDANFFDNSNKQAKAIREKAAEIALKDMLKWLDDDECSDGEDDKISDFSRHSSSSMSSIGLAKLSFQRNERIAIFDATNSTQARRQWLLEECTSPAKRQGNPIGIVFVESVCDDQELLEENYRYKISSSPDFQGMTQAEALLDLRNRVERYEEQYETINDDSMSYIKIFNLSSKLMVNHIYGRMAKELVPALMAWHIGTRPIYLCRPGQTISGLLTDGEDYVNRRKLDMTDKKLMDMILDAKGPRRSLVRGDRLGPNGLRFKEDLLTFCHSESLEFVTRRASVRDMAHTGTSLSGLRRSTSQTQFGYNDGNSLHRNDDEVVTKDMIHAEVMECSSLHQEPFPLRVYTSTMPRASETVNWDDAEFMINQLSSLNPLDKGDYAGIDDLDEMKKMNAKWHEKFISDPFNTRFPGGESYRDLTSRLKSVLVDVEQQVIPTLIVSHVSVLQCIMSYFRNTEVENCMTIDVPMHTVIKFTPVRGGGWSESQHPLDATENDCSSPLKMVSIGDLNRLNDVESTNDVLRPTVVN